MATLYVVATPIGNLADITPRAIEVLRSVDLVACEDTRHTAVLLGRYEIGTKTVSYHQHSSLQKIDWLLSQLKSDINIALVSDAGTPGISDPGGILIDKIHEYNHTAKFPISIVSIPGPSSVMAALSVSGFPADTFLFLGFLPKKKGRQTLLRAIGEKNKALGLSTIAFFESPHRINQTMQDLATYSLLDVNNVSVCLCRELTKKFEEIWRGSLAEAIEKTQPDQKGEFVVVLNLSR